VSEKTGLHPDDQKVVYKDKERDSKAFLDMAGVKDRSKMVMLEDPAAKAKRLLEERRTSKAERAAKAIARVALDVDKLATKVRACVPLCAIAPVHASSPVARHQIDQAPLADGSVGHSVWSGLSIGRCRRWRRSRARAARSWTRTWRR
jgi:hypothetical protein